VKVHYNSKYVMLVPDTKFDSVKLMAFAKEHKMGYTYNDKGAGLLFRIPDNAELCLKALGEVFGENFGKHLADRIGILKLAEFVIHASSQVN